MPQERVLDSYDEDSRHKCVLFEVRQAEIDVFFRLTGERLFNECTLLLLDDSEVAA